MLEERHNFAPRYRYIDDISEQMLLELSSLTLEDIPLGVRPWEFLFFLYMRTNSSLENLVAAVHFCSTLCPGSCEVLLS